MRRYTKGHSVVYGSHPLCQIQWRVSWFTVINHKLVHAIHIRHLEGCVKVPLQTHDNQPTDIHSVLAQSVLEYV